MFEERDGWYIDLPSLGCQDPRVQSESGLLAIASTPERQDREQFKQIGTAPRGFPIEETITRTEADRTTVRKIELLEFADSPPDTSLFQRPSGYALARRIPQGGYDMTQPETLTNRIQIYWTELTGSLRGLFGNR